jgi:hypothetical protein
MTEPQAPPPTFNAMLICDNSIREDGTGKVSLIGIFAGVVAPKFPLVHPSLCVYVNLGDAEGKYPLRLELIRAHDMRTIGRGTGELEVRDRMKPAEIVFELKGLVFESPGRYEFVLYANDRLVGKKSFEVLRLDERPGKGSSS